MVSSLTCVTRVDRRWSPLALSAEVVASSPRPAWISSTAPRISWTFAVTASLLSERPRIRPRSRSTSAPISPEARFASLALSTPLPIRESMAFASPVSCWIDSWIWWVACAVSCASFFTSLATTAKPRPASPARAASMVALSASRLVWLAMVLMIWLAWLTVESASLKLPSPMWMRETCSISSSTLREEEASWRLESSTTARAEAACASAVSILGLDHVAVHGEAHGSLAQRFDGLGLVGDAMRQLRDVGLEVERAQAKVADPLRGPRYRFLD